MCENVGGIVDGESQGKVGDAHTGARVEEECQSRPLGQWALPSHTFFACTSEHEHIQGSSYHVPTMLTERGHGPGQ